MSPQTGWVPSLRTAVLIALALAQCDSGLSAEEGLAPKEADAATRPRTLAFDLGRDVKLEMVLIHPGSFVMGRGKSAGPLGPAHRVTLTTPFYMGKYEVTQKQWETVMGENPSYWQGKRVPYDASSNPVESVTWYDCQTFVKNLNARFPGGGFRLPTEAEWEYACRAGSTTRYCFGDDDSSLADYAWYGPNIGDTPVHPVGRKKPNAWGLYDMHGNVEEWCADWWEPYRSAEPVTNPTGPTTPPVVRVIRGGSWNSIEPLLCWSTRRDAHMPPDYEGQNTGLRVVCAARNKE